MDGLQILPLAITMMVGPQIMSAIIFVTAPRAVRVSLGFLAGVAIATTAGVAIMLGIATLLGSAVDFGNSSDKGSAGKVVQYLLIGLLAAAALKNWLGRETIEPPNWLGTLMSADPKRAFTIGLMVILLMPSDLVVMLTVGVNLEHSGAAFAEALPFIALTVLVGRPDRPVRLHHLGAVRGEAGRRHLTVSGLTEEVVPTNAARAPWQGSARIGPPAPRLAPRGQRGSNAGVSTAEFAFQ